MQLLGMASSVASPQSASLQSLTIPASSKASGGLSLTEYADLARTDPDAYRKLLQSHQQEKERSEVDKLMNFFTRLKYE
ncbi:MAG: hypothetical protein H6R17_4294 [Proteobacteria bacterium]|nr:hypothetical protein [Pseudomonadota bacterium]